MRYYSAGTQPSVRLASSPAYGEVNLGLGVDRSKLSLSFSINYSMICSSRTKLGHYLLLNPLDFDPFVLAFNWKQLVLKLDLPFAHRKMLA